jgi:AraC-like DNA-binding protein
MFGGEALIIINTVCIVFLVTMLVVLGAATRMKGGAGWAAIVIIANLPIILANLMRMMAPEYYLFFLYPAYTMNLLGFPALWFFTRRQLDKSFRLTPHSLFHTIPALVSLVVHIVYYAPLSAAQVGAEIELINAGGKNLPLIINDNLLHITFLVYFTLIIRYARKRMRYMRDNYSDTGYHAVSWMPSILVFYFCGILIAGVLYILFPPTAVWVIPAANMAGIAYLVYCVIFHSTTAYINRLPTVYADAPSVERDKLEPLSEAQMKKVCDKAIKFLTTTGAYTNPHFSLSMLSAQIGTTNRNLSRSINGYLNKHFFDLINEMRIDEAKKRLLSLNENHTIDSVAKECGFGSRSTFFSTFKKAEGKTPQQWREEKLVQIASTFLIE